MIHITLFFGKNLSIIFLVKEKLNEKQFIFQEQQMNVVMIESFKKVFSKLNKLKKSSFDSLRFYFKRNKSDSSTMKSDDISSINSDNDYITTKYVNESYDDEISSKESDYTTTEYVHESYYDENGCPFDSWNLANWDGDQQVGFRD